MSEETKNPLFETPANLETYTKLTLPRLLKPDEFPVGQALKARVERIIGDFTGKEGMEDCQHLWLRHDTGEELLLPLTGVIAQALLKVGSGGVVGKTIIIKRLSDSKDRKFGNRMFMFDIYLANDGSAPALPPSQEIVKRERKNP